MKCLDVIRKMSYVFFSPKDLKKSRSEKDNDSDDEADDSDSNDEDQTPEDTRGKKVLDPHLFGL